MRLNGLAQNQKWHFLYPTLDEHTTHARPSIHVERAVAKPLKYALG